MSILFTFVGVLVLFLLAIISAASLRVLVHRRQEDTRRQLGLIGLRGVYSGLESGDGAAMVSSRSVLGSRGCGWDREREQTVGSYGVSDAMMDQYANH